MWTITFSTSFDEIIIKSANSLIIIIINGNFSTGSKSTSLSSLSSVSIKISTLSETGSDSSKKENSEFYGINAAILVNDGSAILSVIPS